MHDKDTVVTPAIVACCSKAGLAIIRALGRQQIPVIGLRYGTDPSEDESGFIAALLQLDLPGAVVFPSDDGSLVAVSRNELA